MEWLLTPESTQLLVPATQQALNDVVIYLTNSRSQNVTTKHFRELLTHGSMTSDAILNTFLEVLCHDHKIHYLSTYFVTILQRDRSWDMLKNWFTTSTSNISQTSLNSPSILIPCHVQGMHWVGVVRWIIGHQVYFYYADDLNHDLTELQLKQLFELYTDNSFYPSDSIWVKCDSITYRPHSNECGPRTLFALMILGLHPLPTHNTLLPYMTGNLAQIVRTWIAASLLTGRVILPTLDQQNGSSLSSRSTPYYLLSWSDPSSKSPYTLNPLAPIFAPKHPQKSQAPWKLQQITPQTQSTMYRISNLNEIEASDVKARTLPKRTSITPKMSWKIHLCPSRKPNRVAPAPRLAAILPGQTVLSQYFRV